jgi:hypothetical protein
MEMIGETPVAGDDQTVPTARMPFVTRQVAAPRNWFSSAIVKWLRPIALRGSSSPPLPRILGNLRKAFHTQVVDRIAAEIPKELTAHPLAEIEKLIAA